MKHLLVSFLVVLAPNAVLDAQLIPGNYLVGTLGWMPGNNMPNPQLNTVQLVDPHTQVVTVLSVNPYPSLEFPSGFLIQGPTSFLMSTKMSASVASGNVYTVSLQSNGTWSASKLNRTNLPINITGMVSDGTYLYVCGSSAFATTGTDAQILRIRLSNGAVFMHAQFGVQFIPNGANGIGSGLVLIGNTLHTVTFDSTTVAPKNEHWAISTSIPATFRKVGLDLPLSKRFPGPKGYSASTVLIDPRDGNLVIVGRWGELLWRTPQGMDLLHERWPGPVNFTNGSINNEAWRAATVNTDTWALAMGDHDGASIDERRCNGQPPNLIVTDNVCAPAQLSPGTFTVSALAYVPRNALYRPIGDGCADMSGSHPCSYVNSLPTRGNSRFAATVTTTNALVAFLYLGTRLATPSRLSPGCSGYINPIIRLPVVPGGGTATFAAGIAASAPSGYTIYTQWVLIDPSLSRGFALSDARQLTIR